MAFCKAFFGENEKGEIGRKKIIHAIFLFVMKLKGKDFEMAFEKSYEFILSKKPQILLKNFQFVILF